MRRELECPVCLEVTSDSVVCVSPDACKGKGLMSCRTLCGHFSCARCFMQMRSDQYALCPTCRDPMIEGRAVPHAMRAVVDMFEKLAVFLQVCEA
jgi:hypothetical protein